MKRRQFIQRSVLATAAITMPWSRLAAQSAGCNKDYKGGKEVNGDKLTFEISLCPDSVTDLANAGAENKIIKFRAWKPTGPSTVAKEYKADYTMKSVRSLKGSSSDYTIETEFLQINKSEFDFPQELNLKKLTLQFHKGTEGNTLDVLDKKGNIYFTMRESKEGENESCFLTTACVGVLGKADDCRELLLLRNFRDEVLGTSEEGRRLIMNYYKIAPAIVAAIDRSPERVKVYNEIYNGMIQPTIKCIEIDDFQGAIDIYKNYTLKLKESYA